MNGMDHCASKDYQGLTPDTILSAIESLQIYPETGLIALNSYENRVYQFRCDNGQRYVVKFYRPQRWSNDQINEEHDFTRALANAEIPVAVPISVNGQSLHTYQGYRFALFPSIGGRQFEVDNYDHLEQIGRFIGRIHQYSAAQPFQYRRELTPQVWGQNSIDWLKQSGHIPSALSNEYFDTAQTLLTDIIHIWQKTPYQAIRLHGDLHPGNILWTPDGPGFVDLDDACMGPAIQDLWMMLSGDRSQQQIQLDILLEGYEEFVPFATSQLALIEPLRSLRMMHHSAWISRRWDDPAFPLYFPWFAEPDYWKHELTALKEQILLLKQPPLSLVPY